MAQHVIRADATGDLAQRVVRQAELFGGQFQVLVRQLLRRQRRGNSSDADHASFDYLCLTASSKNFRTFCSSLIIITRITSA